MKTLHVDTGREIRGGQWQVLYLLERLQDCVLHAGAALAAEAGKHGIEVDSSWPEADLVHAHDARAHSIAVLKSRKPLIVSRRVGFPIKTSFLSRRKYQRATMYIAVSQFVADRLTDAGVPAEKIRIVYDGVPVPPLPSTREPGRIIALTSKPIAIPGIKIHLTTDLWQDLSTARIFLYPSEMEGLGSAALAAMAAGVPVIASRVGGLPEIVEHQRTGLLADPGGFEDAVRYLLENPTLAAEMGRRGRDRVEANFTADHMTKRTQRVYDEVLR